MDNNKQHRMSLMSLANYIFHKSAMIQKEIYPKKLASTYDYIITYLCESDKPNIFQRDIEKEFNLSRSTVSTILKELESQGLIERKSVLSDARLKKVVPTETARLINSACAHAFEELENQLFDGVEPEKRQIFFDVVDRIKQNVDKNK